MTRASVTSWIRSVLRRRTMERDLHDELTFHVEQYADDLTRKGVERQEALRRARAEFGAVEARKDECREALGLRLVDEWRQDLRFAIRQLRRSPGFTAVAIGTLALGIGANVAIFSVVHALLLKPLPFGPDSDRMVRVMATIPAGESFTGVPLRFPISLTADELRQVLAGAHSLSDAGLASPVLLRFTARGEVGRVQAARLSSSMFRMLHAASARGRLFEPSDGEPGAQPVAILSFRFWQQQFHGDPGILGQTITLATTLLRPVERQFIVVGVMPADFVFPDDQTQLWIPSITGAPATETPQPIRLPMLALLARGASLQAAAAEVEPLVRRLRNIQASRGVTLVREQEERVSSVRPALLMLTVAVGFVLLIACVNMANLLLARSAARQRELAIRAAIGAGRGRLIHQALTESTLLAVIGGAAAIAFATGGIRLLRNLATTLPRFDLANELAFPRIGEISLDVPVLIFAIGVSLLTGLLFGIAPALRHSQADPSEALKEQSPAGSPRALHGRRVLIVVQVAAAMVVLVGAGLLIRSFVSLSRVAPGYQPDNVLTFQVDVPIADYPDGRLRTFAEELTSRIKSIPGVQGAASANQLPMVNMRDTAGGLWKTPNPDRGVTPMGDCRVVSREYLRTLGTRIVAGRGFEERDDAGQPRVLLINESLARREFPNHDPLGTLVYVGRDPMPWQIVGIVQDVRQFGLAEAPDPQFFIDQRQWNSVALRLFPIGMYFAVRTDDDPAPLAPRIAGIVRELESRAVVFNVASMQQIMSMTLARPRLYAVLLGIFAGVAVLLAVIGIYGVMSYSVARRTREFGIRLAIGGQPQRLLRSVLRDGFVLASIGIFCGIAFAGVAAGYLKSLLFGLEPLDLTTFVGASALFAVVVLAASYGPAYRAMKIDPLSALRIE